MQSNNKQLIKGQKSIALMHYPDVRLFPKVTTETAKHNTMSSCRDIGYSYSFVTPVVSDTTVSQTSLIRMKRIPSTLRTKSVKLLRNGRSTVTQ